MKKTVSHPKLSPIPLSLWLPFWLRLKALFRLYLMSLSWLLFNSQVGSCSASILARVQTPQCLCFGGFFVALFQQSTPYPPLPSPLSVSAPQVAGLLPSLQISGRSRLRPFVWCGILPLFSHLACNLNTQNISCLTNRP